MELPELHEQQHPTVHQPQQLRKGCWEVLQRIDIIFQNEVSSLGRRLRISVISKATDRMSNDVERGAGIQKKDRIGPIYYLQELIRSMQRSSSKGDRSLPKWWVYAHCSRGDSWLRPSRALRSSAFRFVEVAWETVLWMYHGPALCRILVVFLYPRLWQRLDRQCKTVDPGIQVDMITSIS